MAKNEFLFDCVQSRIEENIFLLSSSLTGQLRAQKFGGCLKIKNDEFVRDHVVSQLLFTILYSHIDKLYYLWNVFSDKDKNVTTVLPAPPLRVK